MLAVFVGPLYFIFKESLSVSFPLSLGFPFFLLLCFMGWSLLGTLPLLLFLLSRERVTRPRLDLTSTRENEREDQTML